MLNIFLSPSQDTPARKTALLAMQALRADSPLADRLETKHLEIIFSQLYGKTSSLSSDKSIRMPRQQECDGAANNVREHFDIRWLCCHNYRR
jgi:hypothetical protein